MKKLNHSAAAVFLVLCEPAMAQIVPVDWDAAGQFSRELAIPSGKFVEACGKLQKGAKVAWSFESPTPLDFNIHFHEGKKVSFPAKKDKTAKEAGTLLTKLEQDYCWMWTNNSSSDSTLRFNLAKR